jgi:hypothetical protein
VSIIEGIHIKNRQKREKNRVFPISPQNKAHYGENEGQVDRDDTWIIKGANLPGLFHGELLVLVDVFDEVEPQPEEADLDSPLGELMDDHHGKDDE